jgi:diguanylate cyclase (GGDEF)-like protein
MDLGPPAARSRITSVEASDGETFRALFEDLPVGVALSTLDGRFTDVNRTLRDLLEDTGIDLDRGCLADLLRHLPDGGDEAVGWREGLADVRSGRTSLARVELSVVPPDRAPRWVQATAAMVVLGDRRSLLTLVEDATGRRLAEQQLLRLALHDALTGLASPVLLADRLDAAVTRSARSGLPVGVLYFDLDDFERVNVALGHDVGDSVLVALARRLSGSLRASDTAGRVCDDEFVVIAADVTDEAALAGLADRLSAALAHPLELESAHLQVCASIGATLARAGDTLSTVLRRAEADMHEVKRARRSPARIDLDAVQSDAARFMTRPDDPTVADRMH